MTRPLVIAFTAPAGSGKTASAKYLEQTHGFKRLSFAAPIKKLAIRLMGFSEAQVYGTTAEKEAIDPRYGFSARTFMQRLGNEAREILGKRVWIDPVINEIMTGTESRFVIDDLRFLNEAEILRDHTYGGEISLIIIGLETETRTSTDDGTDATEREIVTIESDFQLFNPMTGMDGREGFGFLIDSAIGGYLHGGFIYGTE